MKVVPVVHPCKDYPGEIDVSKRNRAISESSTIIVRRNMDNYRMSVFVRTPLFQLRPFTKQPTGRQDALRASSAREKRTCAHARRAETRCFCRFTKVMSAFPWRFFHCSCRFMSNALTAFRSLHARSCLSPTRREIFTAAFVSACAWYPQNWQKNVF